MNNEQQLQELQQNQQQYEESMVEFLKPETFADVILQADHSSIVQSFYDSIEAGKIDALKALAAIKKLEVIADSATNRDEKKNPQAAIAVKILEYVRQSAALYEGKKFGAFGATFNKTEVGTKYDWSKCEDLLLPTLEEAAKKATEALKERQEFLKKLPSTGITVTDEETGDTWKVYPPAKSSTSAISVSFKQKPHEQTFHWINRPYCIR